MKTVIIHLGTHKAASTSVQLFLSHNREALKALGICYPQAPPPTSFAHHGLAWTIIRRYTSLERRPANYSLDDALDAFGASECDTLLLSSEDFLTTAFYEGFLAQFFTTLRATFDRVVVCAYVRSRNDFFTSSYNEWIKSLSYSKDFESYITQVLKGGQAPMNYTRSLSAWAERADQAVFLPFVPQRFGKRPEIYLLRQLGLSEAEADGLEPFSDVALNPSIGPMSVIAYRRLSLLVHAQDWYDQYALAKLEVLLKELEKKADAREWNSRKFRALTSDHVERVKAVFSEIDDQFAKTHFDAPWSTLFPQDNEVSVTSEISYDSLDVALQEEIDQFVTESFECARAIYCDEFESTDPQGDTLEDTSPSDTGAAASA
jgi:hypothetical protein